MSCSGRGRPRRLSPDEVAALRARPWPRLPWWLWLAVAVTTVTMVVVAAGLFGSAPDQLPVAARRSPRPRTRATASASSASRSCCPENQGRLVRRQASCPRLDQVTLVGTAGEVAPAGRGRRQALRPALDRPDPAGPRRAPGRRGDRCLRQVRAVHQRVDHRFGAGRPAVLVHAKFQQGEAAPDRVAVVLVHEGAHVADGGPPDAAGELAARTAELEACGRLFSGGAQPNRGCADAAALLSGDDASAIQRLKEAGYR